MRPIGRGRSRGKRKHRSLLLSHIGSPTVVLVARRSAPRVPSPGSNWTIEKRAAVPWPYSRGWCRPSSRRRRRSGLGRAVMLLTLVVAGRGPRSRWSRILSLDMAAPVRLGQANPIRRPQSALVLLAGLEGLVDLTSPWAVRYAAGRCSVRARQPPTWPGAASCTLQLLVSPACRLGPRHASSWGA